MSEHTLNQQEPLSIDKLLEEWDRLDKYYMQLGEVAEGAGYDKGSFTGKSIGFSICASQLRATLAKAAAPASQRLSEEHVAQNAHFATLLEVEGMIEDGMSPKEILQWIADERGVLKQLAPPAPEASSLPPITKARKCHKEIHIGAILVYCDLPREHEGECRIPSITNTIQVPEPYSCENSSGGPINVPQMFVPPSSGSEADKIPWDIPRYANARAQERDAARLEGVKAALEEAAVVAEHPEKSDFVRSYKEAWSIEEGCKAAAAIRAIDPEVVAQRVEKGAK